MADVTPFHFPGDTITCHAEANVVGGRFVDISGARVDDCYQVSHAGAGLAAIGVASRDKSAGSKVMVFAGPGTILPMTADGALTAGDEVEVGTDGKPTALDTGVPVGRAMDDALDAATCPIKLY